MHPLLPLLWAFALAFSSSTVPAAEGYKRVNPDGSVEYSDQPGDGAEAVPLPEVQTYTSPPVRSRPAPLPPPAEAKASAYGKLVIITPADEATIRRSAGPVTVRVSWEAASLADQAHRIELLLDGEPVASGTDPLFRIEAPERGAHRLAARIVDGKGKVLIESAPITVYVHQASKLFKSGQ